MSQSTTEAPANLRRRALVALPVTLFLSALLGFGCSPEPASAPGALDLKVTLAKYLGGLPDGWDEMTSVAMNDYIKAVKPFVLDIREAREIADDGYVAGSANIPIRTLIKNLDKLPPRDQPIVVMCSSGHRSAVGMEALQLLGYANVKSLVGGFTAWKAANLPVAAGTPPEPKAGPMPDLNQDLVAALDRYFSNLPNGWRLVAPLTLRDLTASSKPFQLDLREPQEIAVHGFIAGSSPMPLRTLIDHLDQLPPDKGALIIVECDNGHRSAMAMLALGLLRYSYVRSLAGGLNEWTKEGLPVSK
jgi:rhodanese-related sulfurtransferase